MIVRLCLKGVDEIGDRIRFDLSVGEDMKPLPDIVYFGYNGSLNQSEWSSAIILKPDGIIDLGSGSESAGRFHRTNLLNKKIEIQNYITIWWKWAENHPSTYVVEAVTVLSAVTEIVTIAKATFFNIQSLDGLPSFRGRVTRSFDIVGYDDVVYRPPVGIEGDLAMLHGNLIFCPDNAIAKNGQLVTSIVSADDIELIFNKVELSELGLTAEN